MVEMTSKAKNLTIHLLRFFPLCDPETPSYKPFKLTCWWSLHAGTLYFKAGCMWHPFLILL
jgi:hypothetical protein